MQAMLKMGKIDIEKLKGHTRDTRIGFDPEIAVAYGMDPLRVKAFPDLHL